jgi:hypothetical protein
MGKSMATNTSKERDYITHTPAPEREANGPAARPTAEQASGGASGRHPASVYWLITRNKTARLAFFALSLTDGEKVLPVFSSEEEAEMFLSRLGQVGFDGWQARQSTAGELISVLYGPRADVKGVALDPSPEMLVERTVGLVSLSREHFADLLVLRGGEWPLAPRER